MPSESGGAEYLKPVLPESIYPTAKSGSLAKRMLWAERNSSEERRSLLQNARDWVVSYLDWSKISSEIIHLYWNAPQTNSIQAANVELTLST